jgi:hypothetical protein
MYTSLTTKNTKMITKQGGRQTLIKHTLNQKYSKIKHIKMTQKQVTNIDRHDRLNNKVISRSSSEDDSDFE